MAKKFDRPISKEAMDSVVEAGAKIESLQSEMDHNLAHINAFAKIGNNAALEIYESVKVIRARQAHADGPHGIDQWVYQGKLLRGTLTGKPYKLAAYLYEWLDRKVEYADLIGEGKIFSDVQDSTVVKHGRTATLWFSKRGVPLRISTGDGSIWMKNIAEEERKENSA